MPPTTNEINLEMIKNSLRKKRVKKIPKLKEWLYPYALEDENIIDAARVIKDIRKTYNKVIAPKLKRILSLRDDQDLNKFKFSYNTDDIPDDIEATILILESLLPREIKSFEKNTHNTALKLGVFNSKQWKSIVRKAFGVNITLNEPWVKGDTASFTKEGVSLISRVSEGTIKEIGETVQRGYRNGDSWVTISRKINKETFPNNIKRARLIGRDQINKLNGQFTRKRQTDLGLDKYVWRTVIDEKVRPQDKLMEGLICSWKHPEMYYLNGVLVPRPNGASLTHPGYAVRCRCHAEAYFDDILNQL